MTEVFALAGKIVGSVGGRVFLLALVAGRKTDCRMGLGFVEGGVSRARLRRLGVGWLVRGPVWWKSEGSVKEVLDLLDLRC